jgi:probable rRNA maturation factor
MILFDLDQPEAAQGFPRLAVERADGALKSPVPTRPTLMRYLREAQAAVGLRGEVSVLLTTDDGIRGLNRRFRKKNKATDVLSFPVVDSGHGLAGDLAGDLAISVETAARQAREQGHKLSVELRVLMLHGLLHLAGLDHETDDGAMARKERRLRAKLGLPPGLIERVERPAGNARSLGVHGNNRTSGAKALTALGAHMARLKPSPFKAEAKPTPRRGAR